MKYSPPIFKHFFSLLRSKKYYILLFVFFISLGLTLGNLNFKISDSRIDKNNEIPQYSGSGLSAEEWSFVRKFDKPILKRKDFDLPLNELRNLIQQDLSEELKNNQDEIDKWFVGLSTSERLITFLTLKSGLSLPILDSEKRLTSQYSKLLGSESGNCNHHAYRVAFLLDAFGYSVRHVTLSSPRYIMGHAVADVYDPETKTAALVDSNKNFILFLRDVNQSFFETILPIEDIEKRRAILDTVHVQILPNTTKYLVPSAAHFNGWQVGKKPPITLAHVWHTNALGPSNTISALLEGYERLITQKTRDKKHWWLRINDLSTWTKDHKSGIHGLRFYDNSNINAVLSDLRRKRGVSLVAQ